MTWLTIVAANRTAPLRRRAVALALLGGLAGCLCGTREAAARPGWSEVYAIRNLPDSLVLGVDACVRYQRSRLVVKSARDATLAYETAITIFSLRAQDLAKVHLPYDRFHRIDDMQAWILDADGKVVKSFTGGSFTDVKLEGWTSLADDLRAKTISLRGDGLPYTVVYSYLETYRGLLFLPEWAPLPDLGSDVRISLEEAECRVTAPRDFAVRHLAVNVPGEPAVVQDGDGMVRAWRLKALRPPATEPWGPGVAEKLPCVLLGPSKFELAGQKGNMSDWASLGRWCRSLWDGAADLPDSVGNEIAAHCRTLDTRREKIEYVYQKLQGSTRYVSVQLGIGGWQPFPASYVAHNRYGDCKALTNYMMTMLAAAGIPSVPALVKAGEDAPDIQFNFPTSQFNHVILCVPGDGDTTWLECTSNDAPAGHLGAFTENRHVLLLLPEGGRITRTPASRPADNRHELTAELQVFPEGGVAGLVSLAISGNRADQARWRVLGASPRERETWLNGQIGLARAEVTVPDFSGVRAGSPVTRLSWRIRTPEVARRVGDRIVLACQAMDPLRFALPAMVQRRDPVELSYPFVDADTLRFTLPPGFAVDSMPAPVSFSNMFGSYEAAVSLQAGRLFYVRRLEISGHQVPAADYDAFRDFLLGVARADRSQVVLRAG